jgi:hypothetical protein
LHGPLLCARLSASSLLAQVWLGAPQPVQLSDTWQRHSVSVLVEPSRLGHYMAFALVLGGSAAEYDFDDVSITQAAPPRGLSDGTMATSFEEGESDDALKGGLGVVLDALAPSGALVSSRTSLHAALNAERELAMPRGEVTDFYTTVHPTGGACARVVVKQSTTPAWHVKLRLGTVRAHTLALCTHAPPLREVRRRD